MAKYDVGRGKEVQLNINSFEFLQELTSFERLMVKVTTTNWL